MLEKILNNGTAAANDDLLNRKIRVSNLIALVSVIVLGIYTPFYYFLSQEAGILLNIVFWAISFSVFPLLKRRLYDTAFHLHVIAAYVFFIVGTLLYGVETKLHFYMLIMAMIVSVLFDSRKTINTYLIAAVIAFFALTWWSYVFEPFIHVDVEEGLIERVIGNTNLFLLLIITMLFILFFKNDMLRSRKELQLQKTLIEEKNRDITDSINYAKRIQTAMLPDTGSVEALFPGHFLLYHPKDIVSGDFFWIHESGNQKFAAVGDCTGHGVPGAFMSVLGINLLIEIVEKRNISDPAEILNELRKGIIYAFDKEGGSSEYKDGMDISIIRFSKNENTFTYAAANNPVYHFQGEGLTELKADKQPVGYSISRNPFSSVSGTYQNGDVFVLFTDGFADQFGGTRNKKFMYKPFKELLAENSRSQNAERNLLSAFMEWKGKNEQVDDICILGLRM